MAPASVEGMTKLAQAAVARCLDRVEGRAAHMALCHLGEASYNSCQLLEVPEAEGTIMLDPDHKHKP